MDNANKTMLYRQSKNRISLSITKARNEEFLLPFRTRCRANFFSFADCLPWSTEKDARRIAAGHTNNEAKIRDVNFKNRTHERKLGKSRGHLERHGKRNEKEQRLVPYGKRNG
jgi:hypothetical protein